MFSVRCPCKWQNRWRFSCPSRYAKHLQPPLSQSTSLLPPLSQSTSLQPPLSQVTSLPLPLSQATPLPSHYPIATLLQPLETRITTPKALLTLSSTPALPKPRTTPLESSWAQGYGPSSSLSQWDPCTPSPSQTPLNFI